MLNTMCTGIDSCKTPENWFKFLGTYSKNLRIPFNIQVSMIKNTSAKAMRDHAYGCNEASDMSQSRCSCENCLNSCEREEPYPNLEKEGCRLASMECPTAMTLLAFGCICLTIMFIFVAHYVLKHSTDDETDAIPRPEYQLPRIKEAECQQCNNSQLKLNHFSIHDCLRILCIRYSKVIIL